MPNTIKEKIVEQLSEELKNSDHVIVTEYQGLTAEEFDALRSKLKPFGAKYKVVKNRLAKIAFSARGWGDLNIHLKGPSAIAYHGADTAQIAKALDSFSSENKKLRVKAGFVYGFSADSIGIRTIANLPSKEVLLATLLARMNGPLTKLIMTMREPVRSLHAVLSAYAKKKEATAQ